jgi:hypothetical protein
VLTEHLATVESELAHLNGVRQQEGDLQASELERLRAENLALVAQLDQPAAAEVNVSLSASAPPTGLAALFDSPRSADLLFHNIFLVFSVLRIRDVYPGSEYIHPGSMVKKIPDPHQRI